MKAVDYVVIHELVHTIAHDHSKGFWEKVGKIMPNYKERMTWLKKNGQKLIL
jgi:predicted metal-dependent hydrolase